MKNQHSISQNPDSLGSSSVSKKQRQRRPLTLSFSVLPDDALVDIHVVCDVSGKRPTAIHAGVKSGAFPAPEKFGPRCSRWRVGLLRRWLAAPLNFGNHQSSAKGK